MLNPCILIYIIDKVTKICGTVECNDITIIPITTVTIIEDNKVINIPTPDSLILLEIAIIRNKTITDRVRTLLNNNQTITGLYTSDFSNAIYIIIRTSIINVHTNS